MDWFGSPHARHTPNFRVDLVHLLPVERNHGTEVTEHTYKQLVVSPSSVWDIVVGTAYSGPNCATETVNSGPELKAAVANRDILEIALAQNITFTDADSVETINVVGNNFYHIDIVVRPYNTTHKHTRTHASTHILNIYIYLSIYIYI